MTNAAPPRWQYGEVASVALGLDENSRQVTNSSPGVEERWHVDYPINTKVRQPQKLYWFVVPEAVAKGSGPRIPRGEKSA